MLCPYVSTALKGDFMKNHTITILTDYIANQLLAIPPKQAIWRRTLKYLLILIGMAWGVPWIWASMSAAAIFPASIATPVGILFAIGIVFTVGADGWWIMQEASKRLDKLPAAEKNFLILQYGNSRSHMIKTILCWLLATLSCIAPVYATFKYSVGKQQFLAIITLIGCYAYGLIGYARLLDRGMQWLQDRRHSHTLLTLRTQFVRGIHTLQPSFFTAYPRNEWLQRLLANNQTFASTEKTASKKSWLSLGCTILIPLVASLVDVFLISDFLYNHVWSNAIFTMMAAVVAALPALAINMLATYHVMNRLVKRAQSKIEIKKSSRILYLVPTLGALLAPTAAAYITYNTLTAHHLPGIVVFFAVVAISTARILFSWFTLHSLLNEIATCVKHRNGQSQEANHAALQSKLPAFAEAINRINPAHLAGSTD
jgi:hypothetical protein